MQIIKGFVLLVLLFTVACTASTPTQNSSALEWRPVPKSWTTSKTLEVRGLNLHHIAGGNKDPLVIWVDLNDLIKRQKYQLQAQEDQSTFELVKDNFLADDEVIQKGIRQDPQGVITITLPNQNPLLLRQKSDGSWEAK